MTRLTGELSNIFNGTTTIDVKNNPLICFSKGALLEGSEQRLQAVENNLNTYIWSIVLLRESRCFSASMSCTCTWSSR